MLAVTTGAAQAEPINLSGITFSDELGGFVIIDGRGSGSLEDPFVIVEQVATDRPTVLVVRGLTEEFGNPAGTNHFSGFRLIKIVINGTDQTWNGYRMSLEQVLGEGSPRFDGLSFGQEYPPADRSFTADRFSDMTVLDEPLDGIAFAGGSVRPGDRVAFNLAITHNAPREEFFLVQRHEQSIAFHRKVCGVDVACAADVQDLNPLASALPPHPPTASPREGEGEERTLRLAPTVAAARSYFPAARSGLVTR